MISTFIKKWGAKKLILTTFDLLITLLSAFVALFITSNYDFQTFLEIDFKIEKIVIFFLGAFLIIPIFRYYQLYKHKHFHKIGEQTLLILKGLLINSIIIIIVMFLFKTQETLHESRTQVIIYFITAFTLIFISRILIFRKALASNYVAGNFNKFLTRRAIAVGSGNLGQFFAEIISVKPHYHIDLIGFIDDDFNKQQKFFNRVKVIGTTNDLVNIVNDQEIDEIFITIQSIGNKSLFDLIEKCKLTNCQISLVSNHFDIINLKLNENEYHDLKVISVSSKSSPLYSEKFKRLFDIFASSLLILLLIPFTLLVSFLIKLTSKGPVFYKTSVIGKSGKKFNWFKFRTMKAGGDQSVHAEHLKTIITSNKGFKKLENDPRITFIGRLLRKFSIDELPQLLNVFKGQMSLVGPRPCLPYEFDNFKEWHKLKYKVIPGMTGLAQIVARNREDVTFNDSVMLDLYYADNQSLWLDMKILFKTIPIMVLGKGGI